MLRQKAFRQGGPKVTQFHWPFSHALDIPHNVAQSCAAQLIIATHSRRCF
jgi:hypothetical protein